MTKFVLFCAMAVVAVAIGGSAASAEPTHPNFHFEMTAPAELVGGGYSRSYGWLGALNGVPDINAHVPKVGKATVTWGETLFFATPWPGSAPPSSDFGVTFTSVSGDTLTLSSGTLTPPFPDWSSTTGPWSVVSGTGRFASYSGTGTFSVTVVDTPDFGHVGSVVVSLTGTLGP